MRLIFTKPDSCELFPRGCQRAEVVQNTAHVANYTDHPCKRRSLWRRRLFRVSNMALGTARLDPDAAAALAPEIIRWRRQHRLSRLRLRYRDVDMHRNSAP